MMCLRVCQLDRDGLPLLFHYHYPGRRLAARALDKGLLREGMAEANPKAKFTIDLPLTTRGQHHPKHSLPQIGNWHYLLEAKDSP